MNTKEQNKKNWELGDDSPFDIYFERYCMGCRSNIPNGSNELNCSFEQEEMVRCIQIRKFIGD